MTGGKGVDVVYDSVGKTTFEKGLNVLRPRGMMALFGGSSGAVPPFDPIMLTQKGSLYVTRPSLGQLHRYSRRVAGAVRRVFGMIGRKTETADRATYPLAEAQRPIASWKDERRPGSCS